MQRRLKDVAMTMLGAALVCGQVQAQTLEGRVTDVRDVDTIVVAGVPVRLNGIDGPELDSFHGRAAKTFMVTLVLGEQLVCQLNGERTHDRQVGVCFLDGEDIGALAVASGQALDCRRYSGGRYRNLETSEGHARIARAPYC